MAKRKTAMKTVVDVDTSVYPEIYNSENMPPIGVVVTPLNSQLQNLEVMEVEARSWPGVVMRSLETGKQVRYDLRGVHFVQLAQEYIDAVMHECVLDS